MNLSANSPTQLLSSMMLIRAAELKISIEAKKQTFKTPIHLAIGQEAVAVGVAMALKNSDTVFGNHRSHGHYLATGGELTSLFSEILGNADGCSGGRGGSMHITSRKTGFMGSMPIVGGTIPVSLGAALAHKRSGSKGVSVVFFGDGAAEEGVFHESLNLAAIMSLPILFVCENNLFSSHLHISERQKSRTIQRFAEAHQIESHEVDGNDVRKVSEMSNKLIEFMRSESKPAFIEAMTYRLFGHVGPEIDEEIGFERERDLKTWRKRDPIERELNDLFREGILNRETFATLSEEINQFVIDCWERARRGVKPDESTLLKNVLMDF